MVRNIILDKQNMKLEEGRVVIDSNELANAIQNSSVDVLADEEQEFISINFCKVTS